MSLQIDPQNTTKKTPLSRSTKIFGALTLASGIAAGGFSLPTAKNDVRNNLNLAKYYFTNYVLNKYAPYPAMNYNYKHEIFYALKLLAILTGATCLTGTVLCRIEDVKGKTIDQLVIEFFSKQQKPKIKSNEIDDPK